jgi:hypothetical protein
LLYMCTTYGHHKHNIKDSTNQPTTARKTSSWIQRTNAC